MGPTAGVGVTLVFAILGVVISVMRAAGRQNVQRARDRAAQVRHDELIAALRARQQPPAAAQPQAAPKSTPRPGRTVPAPPAGAAAAATKPSATSTPKPRPPADAIPTELLVQAARQSIVSWSGSSEALQYTLRIGRDQAEQVLDELERYGIVGPAQGEDPRTVLTPVTHLDQALARIRAGVYDTGPA